MGPRWPAPGSPPARFADHRAGRSMRRSAPDITLANTGAATVVPPGPGCRLHAHPGSASINHQPRWANFGCDAGTRPANTAMIRSVACGAMRSGFRKAERRPRAYAVGYRVSGKTGHRLPNQSQAATPPTGSWPYSRASCRRRTRNWPPWWWIDEPSRDVHEVGTLAQGGTVAAPVFASVMSGALRLMDVPPDDLQNVPAATLVQATRPHEHLTHMAARRHRSGAGQRCPGRGPRDRQP